MWKKIVNFINSWMWSAIWLVWSIGWAIYCNSHNNEFGFGINLGLAFYWLMNMGNTAIINGWKKTSDMWKKQAKNLLADYTKLSDDYMKLLELVTHQHDTKQ